MRTLSLKGLTIGQTDRRLVDDVHWSIGAGQLVGLTGPSGSGKTLCARAALGLTTLPVVSGSLELRESGRIVDHWSLIGPSGAAVDRLQPVRGYVASYLPQHADQCLDPVRSVGAQVSRSAGGSAARWLRRAGFRDPAAVLASYPHTLSGGMARRVALAMAIGRGSQFLLLDEPTAGLDAVTAQHVVATLCELVQDGLGVLWITHDFERLCALADHAVVLSHGRHDETLDTQALRSRTPARPVAQDLIDHGGGSR